MVAKFSVKFRASVREFPEGGYPDCTQDRSQILRTWSSSLRSFLRPFPGNQGLPQSFVLGLLYKLDSLQHNLIHTYDFKYANELQEVWKKPE